jgi:biotin operon repressor
MPAETVWQFVKRPDYPKEGSVKSKAVLDNLVGLLEENGKPVGLEELRQLTGYSRDTVRPTLYHLQKHYQAVKLVEVRGRKVVDLDAVMKFPSVRKWISELKPGDSQRDSKYRFCKVLQIS